MLITQKINSSLVHFKIHASVFFFFLQMPVDDISR